MSQRLQSEEQIKQQKKATVQRKARSVRRAAVKVNRERIEMRVDPDIKKMAERASATLGFASLTEYVANLIRENAPKVLAHDATIQLANAQFDHFLQICNDTERKPSKRILDAAKRLDDEGY